jgi:hypothetical protein
VHTLTSIICAIRPDYNAGHLIDLVVKSFELTMDFMYVREAQWLRSSCKYLLVMESRGNSYLTVIISKQYSSKVAVYLYITVVN